MNTEIGAINMTKVKVTPKIQRPHGLNAPDPFFDSYEEEFLTACDMLEEAGIQGQKIVTITLERTLLKKLIQSHLRHIRSLES